MKILLAAFTAIAVFIADGQDFSNESEHQLADSEDQLFIDINLQDILSFEFSKKDQQLEKVKIPRNRRRRKSLCRRKLGGQCVRRRKRCPGHLSSQKSPGKPYCSKFHRCCHQADKCSEAEGFFKVSGSGNQCFKFFNESGLAWEAAKSKCQSMGLQLAKPEDPLALRKFMVENYGTTDVGDSKFPWIGAQGTGPSEGTGSVEWIRDGSTLNASSFAWYNGHPGLKTSTDYCLTLMSWHGYLTYSPIQPYFMTACWREYYPLCELIM